jgi:uncharacterized protein involved in exopolysaccharide biosynthesis
MDQKINKQEQEAFRSQIAEDEINLVDLFLILWKRKTMIIGLTILLTVAAAGISFILPKVYEVTTMIEPGKDSEGQVVENPQAIRENILGGAYDLMISERLGLPLNEIPQFKVSVPKLTDLVKISVESSEPRQAVQVLQELLVGITKDIQAGLDIEIKKTQNEIRETQMKDGFLLDQISLLKEQIAQVVFKMTELEKERKKALAAPKGDAMAVLLYSNEIQNQQIYLNDLQEKLANTLNKKSQIALQIDNVQLKLSGIKGTNINKPPSVPEKTIKPKKTLIVALAAMLGLMGGVMLAFFAEFIAKVRKQQQVPE